MAANSIIAQDLTYRYGDLLAVDGISFEVAEGEILGFLGPNGAGKSTTVKLLTGQLKPAAGSATLMGMDIVKERNKVQQFIGVAFEQANLYEEMSAAENLTFFGRLYGVKPDVDELLAQVGLTGREKERVQGFSKGMKQRLMIARALVNNPRILFLDEPTDGLDPVSSEAIRKLILRMREGGTTVFLTTHDMYEADQISDRVAFINQGSIVALDTPHALKQQYGKRALKVELARSDGSFETVEYALDNADVGAQVKKLLDNEQVVTVHSEEATLEDIFIQITGTELAQ